LSDRYKYQPLLRPASFATLPPGLAWEYVESPTSIGHNRPDLPMSIHTHGIIATTRQLTAEELDRYSLRRVE
jgi:hypothetical protein